MKKFLLAATAIMCGCTLLAQQTIKDPNAEVREAKNFHTLKISHAFEVYITQGDEEGLAVSASETKYLAFIKTEVKDGELRISYDAEGRRWNTSKMKFKAYISFKNLDKLHVTGACDINITGILKADDLDINLSGASDIRGRIEVKKLVIDMSGASDIKISGSAVDTKIIASGASNFKGYDFAVDYCYADASGASDIRITVNKEFAAEASGASDIHYKGECMIRELKSSSASSISKG